MKMIEWKRAGFCVVALAALSSNDCALAVPAAATIGMKPPLDLVDVPSRFVLMGNPDAGERDLADGATYTANPAFDNTSDPQNNCLTV